MKKPAGENEVIDIHGRDRRRQRIEELLNESGILKENRQLIMRYVDFRTVQSDISLLRQEKIISNLMTFAGFLDKPFKEADKGDIERIVNNVYSMSPSYILRQQRAKGRGEIDNIEYVPEKNNKKKLAASTRNCYCKILKMFFVWFKGERHPKETEWLEPPRYKPKKLTTEDKITWSDVEKLSKAATNKRDFLMPQILMDFSGRAEELLTLRLSDIEIIKLNGKDTKKPKLAAKIHIRVSKTETRSPMVHKCVPALIDYINNSHPLKNDKTAPLFVNLTKPHTAMSYKQARVILMNLKKRAGLKNFKNGFHIYRKSSCSICGDLGMGDSQIDKRFGWAIGSRVKRAYLFPEESKANEAYLRGQGVIPDEEEDKDRDPNPVLCMVCETLNPIGKDYCINPECRMPLAPDQNAIDDKNKVRMIVMEALQEIMGKQDISKALAGLEVTGKG